MRHNALVIVGTLSIGMMLSNWVFAEGQRLEEIVVTAQKRTQSIQSVPVAVSVLSGREVTELGVHEPIDIAHYIPNVSIKDTLGYSNPVITIRGIGLNDFIANNDQTAGVYIDQVYMASPAMMSFQAFDIQRVEVLKGPQGTLYGKNTTAGAIRFITNKPTRKPEGYLQLGYGRYDRGDATGAISGPLTDNLEGRLAFTGSWSPKNTGPFLNRVTGHHRGALDRWAARGILSWQPNDQFKVLVNLHGGKDLSEGTDLWQPLGVLSKAAGPFTFPLVECPTFLNGGSFAQVHNNCIDFGGYQNPTLLSNHYVGDWSIEPKLNISQWGATVRADWTLPKFTITSITGYEGYHRFLQEDGDGGPLVGSDINYVNDIWQVSEELRLTSTQPWRPEFLPGELNYIFGFFYETENRKGDPSQDVNARDWFNDRIVTEWNQPANSEALYAHLDWRFNEHWSLALGGRYTYAAKSFVGSTFTTGEFGFSFLTGVNGPVILGTTNDHRSTSEFTGDVSLNWTPTEDWLVYGKVSRGFKAGGFNGGIVFSNAELMPFRDEHLTAYELGVKATALNRTLRVNTALFYYDYRDEQLFSVTAAPLIVFTLTNAKKSSLYGLDTDIWWRPIEGLDVKASVGWLHTKNEDPRFRGKRLANAPDITFNGLIRYKVPLRDDWALVPMIDFSYTGDMFKTVDNKRLLKSKPYWLLNGRLALKKNNWEVAGWVKNVTNDSHIVEAFDLESLGSFLYLYNQPRTWGVSVRYDWR